MEGVTVGPNKTSTESNSQLSFIELLPLNSATNVSSGNSVAQVQQQFSNVLSNQQGNLGGKTKQSRLSSSGQLHFNEESSCNSVFGSNNSFLTVGNSVFLLNGSPVQLVPTTTVITAADKITKHKETNEKWPSKNKSGWQKGKRRKRPHPRLKTPASPSSAYLIYCKKRRPEIQNVNPELSFPEISKLIGKEWNNLSRTDKIEYQKMAQEDICRYKQELQEYQKSEEYKAFVAEMATADNEGSATKLIDSEIDLYCAPCDSHFLNFHNKEEHLNSTAHRKKIVGAFETFLTKKSKAEKCHSVCVEHNQSNIRIPETTSVDELELYFHENDCERNSEKEYLQAKIELLQSKLVAKRKSALELEKTLSDLTQLRNGLNEEKLIIVKRLDKLKNVAGLEISDMTMVNRV